MDMLDGPVKWSASHTSWNDQFSLFEALASFHIPRLALFKLRYFGAKIFLKPNFFPKKVWTDLWPGHTVPTGRKATITIAELRPDSSPIIGIPLVQWVGQTILKLRLAEWVNPFLLSTS